MKPGNPAKVRRSHIDPYLNVLGRVEAILQLGRTRGWASVDGFEQDVGRVDVVSDRRQHTRGDVDD